MRILVDTNVLLDVLAERENFFESSFKIFELCQQEVVFGAVAAHSINNIVYILRKNFSLAEIKQMLKRLFQIFYIDALNYEKIFAAVEDDNFSDFEDCLQTQCALNFQADFIITRNVKDFKFSGIPAITPEDLCKLFEQGEN